MCSEAIKNNIEYLIFHNHELQYSEMAQPGPYEHIDGNFLLSITNALVARLSES